MRMRWSATSCQLGLPRLTAPDGGLPLLFRSQSCVDLGTPLRRENSRAAGGSPSVILALAGCGARLEGERPGWEGGGVAVRSRRRFLAGPTPSPSLTREP